MMTVTVTGLGEHHDSSRRRAAAAPYLKCTARVGPVKKLFGQITDLTFEFKVFMSVRSATGKEFQTFKGNGIEAIGGSDDVFSGETGGPGSSDVAFSCGRCQWII
jgi:hypothetical protein